MKRLFFTFAAALIFFAGLQSFVVARSQNSEPQRASDFSLKDLKGHTVHLSDFRGKVVLLDFWATWCPPCRAEIPHLVEYQKTHTNKGFVILGIALDDEGAKVVKPFADEFKMNYPVLIADGKVQETFGPILGIPTKVIVDKNGKIVGRLVGYQNISNLEKKIQPYL